MATLYSNKALKSGIIAGLLVFVITCLATVLLFFLSSKHQFAQLKNELINLSKVAALHVDTEEHKKLTQKSDTNGPHYQKIIEPLVNIHNAVPDILYLYTMREIDGKVYYILDTANDHRLLDRSDKSTSHVMEEYHFDPTQKAFVNWLPNLHSGKIDIDDEFYNEDDIYLLTASVPLFEPNGKFFGMLGMDIDVSLFQERRQFVTNTMYVILFVAFLISIVIGNRIYAIRDKLRISHQKLVRQASTDFLTKAYNRRFFIDQAEREIARSLRSENHMTLLMIDIDHFKKINDTYGHIIGDEVLVMLVDTIKEIIRLNDLLARFGGEEFILLLPDTRLKDAMILAERIKKLIEKNHIKTTDQGTFNITLSIGIAEYEQNIKLDDWIHNADEALYTAKNSGRNQVRCHQPATDISDD